MKIHVARVLGFAVVVEVLSVAVLVALVALRGPSDPEAAQAYAERLGAWVGPIAGMLLCAVGGALIARRLAAHHVANGLALGVAVAAIDVALLVVGGAAFEWVFVASNVGRAVAGALGARLGRRDTPATA